MSWNNFIPKVWSANFIREKERVLVFGGVCNREYEGEISGAGDRVKVSTIGDITVDDYVKNTTSITPESLSDASRELIIDQSKYFAFAVDDLDSLQMKPKMMSEAERKAAVAMKNVQDQYIAALATQAGLGHPSYPIGTPANITSDNVEQIFAECAEEMMVKDVEMERLFAIIPPWLHTKLYLAGLGTLSQNVEVWNNGRVGRFAGFDLRVSNNVVKNSTSWDISQIVMGVLGESIALAEQLVKVEAFRPESSFSDAVKGLHVYGAKVMRPDKTLTLYADKTAES